MTDSDLKREDWASAELKSVAADFYHALILCKGKALSATKCDSWLKFGREVESVEHVKKTISAPTLVEIDSFQGNCHISKECRSSRRGREGSVRAVWKKTSLIHRKKDGKVKEKEMDREHRRAASPKEEKVEPKGKAKGKGKRGQRLNEITEPPEEQWTSGFWEHRADQSCQTDADSASWREADDWYTAESSSQASAAAEEFQHASFVELRLSNFGFASHIESFQPDRLDSSQRTITFFTDTAGCKTVVLARDRAARLYSDVRTALQAETKCMTKERESCAP